MLLRIITGWPTGEWRSPFDELDISVTADSLSISGKRKIAVEKENARYHRSEREAGKLSRMITLPSQEAEEL
jgi:HSP20 family molecular chaperone IbpA